MKKGIVVFLFSSALLSFEMHVDFNETQLFLANANPEQPSKNDTNDVQKKSKSDQKNLAGGWIGFKERKTIRKSPVLNQPVDFSPQKNQIKKAQAYISGEPIGASHLGNLLEGISGNLIFGVKPNN